MRHHPDGGLHAHLFISFDSIGNASLTISC